MFGGVGFEVMEGEACEVGDEDVAGGFVGAVLGVEVLDVVDGLGVDFGEVAAAGFVFGD